MTGSSAEFQQRKNQVNVCDVPKQGVLSRVVYSLVGDATGGGVALDPKSPLPCSLLDDAWAKRDLGLTLYERHREIGLS